MVPNNIYDPIISPVFNEWDKIDASKYNYDFNEYLKAQKELKAKEELEKWDGKTFAKQEWTVADDAEQSDKDERNAKIADTAAGVLNFGTKMYGTFDGTDSSKKESDLKTVGMTLEGAKLGMELGGPWGAAAGGVLGLGAGLINAKKDKEKRYKIFKNKDEKRDVSIANSIQKNYNIEEGNDINKGLLSLRDKQTNILNG